MTLDFHPELRIHKLCFGREGAPLLIIDNFVAEPERLIKKALTAPFSAGCRLYPGIRAKAPPSYEHFLVTRLQPLLAEHFGIASRTPRLSMCHFSLVTTPPSQLEFRQRIAHVDSLSPDGLASVHYLFKTNLGGTAFYRHRATGYESLNEVRVPGYFRVLEMESAGANRPEANYINGDTPLLEQIARAEGVFNRVLIYRRNSLHSGSIDSALQPDSNPRTGRLSINSFIDPE